MTSAPPETGEPFLDETLAQLADLDGMPAQEQLAALNSAQQAVHQYLTERRDA